MSVQFESTNSVRKEKPALLVREAGFYLKLYWLYLMTAETGVQELF